MKTLLLAILTLAAACFGEDWHRSMAPSFSAPLRPFRWGQLYTQAVATVQPDGSLFIRAREGKVTIAAAQVTASMREEIIGAYELAKKTNPIVKAFEQKRVDEQWGIVSIRGSILGRTDTGFLAKWGNERVHIKGMANLADGDDFSGRFVEDGFYQYVTVLGAAATVRAYRPVPPAK